APKRSVSVIRNAISCGMPLLALISWFTLNPSRSPQKKQANARIRVIFGHRIAPASPRQGAGRGGALIRYVPELSWLCRSCTRGKEAGGEVRRLRHCAADFTRSLSRLSPFSRQLRRGMARLAPANLDAQRRQSRPPISRDGQA